MLNVNPLQNTHHMSSKVRYEIKHTEDGMELQWKAKCRQRQSPQDTTSENQFNCNLGHESFKSQIYQSVTYFINVA